MFNENQTLEQALAELGKPVFIPKDIYNLEVVDAVFGDSKGGIKQFTLTCEIRDHQGLLVTNNQTGEKEMVDINGTKGQSWVTLSPKAWAFTGKIHKALGLPTDITLAQLLASPNPEIYKGAKGKALCGSTKQEVKNELTGQPVIDPNTNEPIVRYQFQINEWY